MTAVKSPSPIPHSIYDAVEHLPGALLCHDRRWHGFLEATCGWSVQAVVVERSGRPVAFLPFIEKRTVSMQRKQMALPLSHLVPPLFAPDISAEERSAFFEALARFDSFEIRADLGETSGAARVHLNDLVALDLAAIPDIEKHYATLSYQSVRGKVNRARKRDVIIESHAEGAMFDRFEDLEAETRRRVGAPMYPRGFFGALHGFFRGTGIVELQAALLDGRLVSGLVLFHHGGSTLYAYGAMSADPEDRKTGANFLNFWTAIEKAHRSGQKTFDFGTTPVHLESLRHFKESWGGATAPLNYSFYPSSRKPQVVNRSGPMVKAAEAVLKTLPMPLYRSISPLLLKWAL